MRFLALSEQQSEPPQLKHWGQQQQQQQHRHLVPRPTNT